MNPVHLPCSSCQGRRFYVIPKWESIENGVMKRPVTISAMKTAKSFMVDPVRDFHHIPVLLRVCVQCGAMQPFADPAAVQLLTQTQPPVAFFVDASEPPPPQR